SSNGFIAIFTLASSTPLPSAFTRTLTFASTTRLTGTRIFISITHLSKDAGSALSSVFPTGLAECRHRRQRFRCLPGALGCRRRADPSGVGFHRQYRKCAPNRLNLYATAAPRATPGHAPASRQRAARHPFRRERARRSPRRTKARPAGAGQTRGPRPPECPRRDRPRKSGLLPPRGT